MRARKSRLAFDCLRVAARLVLLAGSDKDTSAAQGIIHRDLKTNNIFCCANGIVKLGDFGISKMLTGGKRMARTMVGTPYYMSPEIIKVRSAPLACLHCPLSATTAAL